MMDANENVIHIVISGLAIEPGRDKWTSLINWEKQASSGKAYEDPTE